MGIYSLFHPSGWKNSVDLPPPKGKYHGMSSNHQAKRP
jgi:hypothetical protein